MMPRSHYIISVIAILGPIQGFRLSDLEVLQIDKTSSLTNQDKCVLIPHSQDLKHDAAESSLQKISLSLNHRNLNLQSWSYYLKFHAWCVIGYGNFSSSSFSTMSRLLYGIDNHRIIIDGNYKPEAATIKQVSSRLVYRREEINNAQRIDRWCPTYGRIPNRGFHPISLCRDNKCVSKSTKCLNPLHNQHIIAGCLPSVPLCIPPAVVAGETSVSGYHMRIVQILAAKFSMTYNVSYGPGGAYDPVQNRFSPGVYQQVLDGDADMCTSSAYFQFTNYLFDLSGTTNFDESLYMSRALRTRISWGNISNPFSVEVWIFTLASLLALTVYFVTAYKVYSSNDLLPHFLFEYEPFPSNFLLFTCFKFSEQEPLPWFIRRWTSGRMITLLWAVLAFFVISAYNSNLRAHMITAEYEHPIDTLQDVVDYAEKVWIYDVATTSRKEYLAAIGMVNSVDYKIAVLAEETDGWYSVNLGSRGLGGIDLRVPDVNTTDIQVQRSVFMMVKNAVPYLYKLHPNLERSKLHFPKEYAAAYYGSLLMRKHNPASKYVQETVISVVESGLSNYYLTEHLPLRAVLAITRSKVGLVPLQLRNFATSFLVLGCGLLISLIFFLFRELRKRLSRRAEYDKVPKEIFDMEIRRRSHVHQLLKIGNGRYSHPPNNWIRNT